MAAPENEPDGVVIHAPVAEDSPREPRGRLLPIAGAAVLVVAAAVIVPIVAHGTPTGTAPPAAAPAHPAAPAAPVTELDLAPRWLPGHVVELERTSDATSFSRTWIDGEIDDNGTPVISPGLTLSVGPGHLPDKGKPVTINGKPAKELVGENDTRVVWEQKPGTLVTVSASLWRDEEQAGIAERVAKSLQPAEAVRFAPQLRIGHLPAGWTYVGGRIFGSHRVPTNSYLTARTVYQGHEFLLTIGFLSNGRTGLVAAQRDGYDLGAGPKNQSGHLPGWPDFSGLLKAFQLDPHADVSWVGRR